MRTCLFFSDTVCVFDQLSSRAEVLLVSRQTMFYAIMQNTASTGRNDNELASTVHLLGSLALVFILVLLFFLLSWALAHY